MGIKNKRVGNTANMYKQTKPDQHIIPTTQPISTTDPTGEGTCFAEVNKAMDWLLY